ncbi:hypothetical protein A2856_00555 [Candidatus Uhrbacteria bacterium RIFCSPHIGHO2_01_FULL_63_20]|uniref:SpoVT-AbrB domain-containing protein n=1 Tax=Candidatus Uhrbacteria bacterium RIFCSPHIGHO2_01_FULL_63_20 TaxID=1802385 RepID=A0A1F7TN50_9BACT|nr:MAG: hypothetical protein A2856_00555 [Candidatus Uhrbacteria bacterium RIFCSPHIGHO2_01_FULL_63_20]
MQTLVKATTKGQITLPAKWRKTVRTDRFIVEERHGNLEIVPFHIKRATKQSYETVFNAERDNKGKGIEAKKLLKVLKKLR